MRIQQRVTALERALADTLALCATCHNWEQWQQWHFVREYEHKPDDYYDDTTKQRFEPRECPTCGLKEKLIVLKLADRSDQFEEPSDDG
jgi:hypothetical protein